MSLARMLIVIVCLSYVSISWSDAHAEENAKAQLLELLAPYKQLSAQFQQVVVDRNGEQVQQLEGSLHAARPAKLYWETLAPDESVLVADGETIWYYNPFVEQVSIYSQQESLQQSPFLLLFDPTSPQWQNYSVEQDEGRYWIIGQDAAVGQRIAVQFNSQQQLSAVVVDDGQGQVSTISLTDIDSNITHADGFFQFTPPAGTFIDDQRGDRDAR
ncbi:outer membrane lipoprotein chaperone LolA [Pseudidiomarina taiwanensis]|uniref:Outer-membrane lipoprotein carrier protein n=1 Tax=Pseudidiomarina taiwanensis TaxID=337250 RepID=A0A432ZN51_9GAMM|nr:outer membrane lipoprotein chaperone LolA [Pseudidiomarina taiwanensis]RUO79325.1 outer membrane lipoprotein carrier protein LolA [Pseudidiomarina taiwanensis]